MPTPLKRPVPKTRKPDRRREELTPRQRMFAHEFVRDFNGTQAATRAGFSRHTAVQIASELLRMPKIQAVIGQLLEQRRERIDIKIDDVAWYWYTLATADPRELNPVKVGCCRYCHGDEHRYQFTLNEFREARTKHLQSQLRIPNARDRREFDEKGGLGFDSLRYPMRGPRWGDSANADHDCPECNGKGVPVVVTIDVDRLSPGALMLFKSMKISKDGAQEIQLNDRLRAMENFADLMGIAKKPLAPVKPGEMDDAQLEEVVQHALESGLLQLEDLSGGDNLGDSTIEGEFTTEGADA